MISMTWTGIPIVDVLQYLYPLVSSYLSDNFNYEPLISMPM